jgi:hypothetical protein
MITGFIQIAHLDYLLHPILESMYNNLLWEINFTIRHAIFRKILRIFLGNKDKDKGDNMKNHFVIQKSFLILVFLILAGGMVSCTGETDTRPRVWIDSPRGGASVPVDVPVVVLSHGYAREGIAEVVLYVNSTAYRSETPSELGADFSEFRHEWVPTEPGDYTLQVWIYDSRGEIGDPATIAIHVGEETIVELPEPILETNTPTATFVPTSTPTRVPTSTNPPPLPPPTKVPTKPPPPPPPQDTTPPPVPSPAVPADGLAVSCRSSQTLAWLPVQDTGSGIDGYFVTLQREITAGNWQNVNSWGPVSGKQVSATVDCGIKYRWRVRARDGAGNNSNWSAYSHFAIDLT